MKYEIKVCRNKPNGTRTVQLGMVSYFNGGFSAFLLFQLSMSLLTPPVNMV